MTTDENEHTIPTLGATVINHFEENGKTVLTLVDKYGRGTRVHLSPEQRQALRESLQTS